MLPGDAGWTRLVKEILLFVFLSTFALGDFAIAKEKICEQRKWGAGWCPDGNWI
jgi:hypothetical protein